MNRTAEIAAATFLAPAVVDGRECVCKRLEKSTLEYDFLGSPVNRVFNYDGPSLDGFGRGRESNPRPVGEEEPETPSHPIHVKSPVWQSH